MMTRIDNDESRRLYSWLREVIRANGQVKVYVKIRRTIPIVSFLALQVSLGLPVTFSTPLPPSTPSTTLYRDGRMVTSRQVTYE